ncbi:MAG TPA: SBBP repeat-containing protein, partial [Anaerolineales bacterium]|nr:SBBP repeat-containing protein [Anaerolineales bacterium]
MSTLKPGTEIMTRIVLTAVILLNALVPTASVAQAATESTAAVPAKLAPAERENSSIRTFKRPEARVADHVSDISSFPTNSSSQADQAIKKNNASPLMFIENIGQFDPRALFVAQGSDTNIYLSQNELWFTVAEKIKKEKPAQDPLNKPKKIKVVNLKMIFPGSNSEPEIQPFDKLDVRVSRFIGNDPSKYSTNIPVWNGIRYADLYPGADLELTSENGMFVWRIVVKDSVRFSQDTYIRSHGLSMKIAGQKQLALDNGKLKIKTDLGDYNLPQVQVTGTIDSKVFSLAPKVVGDELLLIYPKGLSFDSNHGGLGVLASLAIEQTNRNSLIQLQEEISSNISFLILIGGGDYDDAWGQAVGPDGSMFVTGETESTDYFPNFPGYDGSYNGLSDAFVVKINPDGDVMYATYVGGSEREFGMAIAVNKQGEAYVAGGIASMDFPLAGNPISTVGRAGFLIKLNESGDQLLYSSFVGSINEYIISMRIDAQENVYMLEGGLGNQGIVYKLKPGDNHYIYPPHTLAAGNWFSIAVDANGNAFLTGSTSDPNSNVLATKLNNAGSTVYSRSFGGNGADGGWGIAVDENGYAYITGDTTSPDFPLEGSPLTGRQSLTAYDAFVTILDPDGVIWYSSYLDMSADIDQGIGIAVDSYGSIYISGNTSDGIDYWSVFVVRLTPSNPAEGYKIGSIDLIGDSMIYGGIGTVDGHGNVYVAGSEWDVNYNYDAFLAVVSTWPTVPDISIVSSCTEDSCIAPVADTQSFVGGPINTRTGNYEYSREDISIMTSAGSLAFTRDYSSSNIGLATPLSPGWTHNHDIRLTFPTAPEGQSGKVLFKAHTANKYIFTINDDGTYSAYPGLTATLVNNQGSYVLKDSSQNTYTFDSSGKLQLYADAQGHTWNYVYDSTSGKLIRINPDGSTHYLSLHYDPQGRIDSVSDRTVPTGQIERSVTYQYGSNGDLDDVSDVLGHHWTYEYTNHLLTRVAAPGDVAVERTDYDSEGRAWRQFGPDADGDGQDDLVIELTYNVDGTTTLKDRVNDPDPEIHTYDERGTLISDQDGMGGMQKKDYDFNFRPGIITDALKNTTTLNWSDNGANLTYIKDALNGETSIEYENPDSPNSPTKITDPLDYVTTYSYDTHFPSLPTRIEYPLSFDNGISYIGTDYEYYQPNNSEDQPAGKLHIATDALGHKAHYTYTSSGQPDVVITAYQTAAAQTTDYDYDDLGRPVRVIDPSGVITRNKYDAAGQLIVTINNVNPSTP